mmetsp:Transcript_5553/g.20239  ORF Transcript_5553/g.20239 Transcript_5553/m.20239 type:complete len:84 (+) Transcript_5553:219-470(+)
MSGSSLAVMTHYSGKTLVHRVKGLAQAASTHEVTDPPYAMGANDVSVLDLLKDDAEQAETEATLCRVRGRTIVSPARFGRVSL